MINIIYKKENDQNVIDCYNDYNLHFGKKLICPKCNGILEYVDYPQFYQTPILFKCNSGNHPIVDITVNKLD